MQQYTMASKTTHLDTEAVDNALLINAIYAEMNRQGMEPSVFRLWRVLRILSPYWQFWR